jgi:hypothetical protein
MFSLLIFRKCLLYGEQIMYRVGALFAYTFVVALLACRPYGKAPSRRWALQSCGATETNRRRKWA